MEQIAGQGRRCSVSATGKTYIACIVGMFVISGGKVLQATRKTPTGIMLGMLLLLLPSITGAEYGSVHSLQSLEPLWTQVYAGEDGSVMGADMVVNDAGDILVCGSEYIMDPAGFQRPVAFVRVLDEEGTLQWEDNYEGPGSSAFAQALIAGEPDDPIYLGGRQTAPADSGYDMDMFLRKYNASGSLEWSQIYDPADRESGILMRLLAIGDDIAAAGYVIDDTFDPMEYRMNWYVMLLDGESGDVLWSHEWESSQNRVAFPTGMTAEGGSEFLVWGYVDGEGNSGDAHLMRFSLQGDVLTEQTYSFGEYNVLSDVMPYEDGHLFIGSTGVREQEDILLMRLDGNDETMWQVSYNGAQPHGRDQGAGLIVFPDGAVLAGAGMTTERGDVDACLMRINPATGDSLGTSFFTMPASDETPPGLVYDFEQDVEPVLYTSRQVGDNHVLHLAGFSSDGTIAWNGSWEPELNFNPDYMTAAARDPNGFLVTMASDIATTTEDGSIAVRKWDRFQAVMSSGGGSVPDHCGIDHIRPNPSNNRAILRFHLVNAGRVSLSMYDMLGRRVRVIQNGVPMHPGSREITIDGTGLPSGTYFLCLELDGGPSETESWRLVR
ncbi:T9SS type A sorting domain-containing protein [bacterium]|nr:T9SS type A sorting domain-containing protein [bacterium]